MTETRPFVVAANRLPVQRHRRSGWEISPGGLVSALSRVARSRPTAWVGWAGDRAHGLEPFEHDGTWLVPVPVTAGEVADYYDGFSNGSLWPLFHDLILRPEYHRHWYDAYRRVNDRFAAAIDHVAADGATVWVHDYQLLLVPQLLRERRPDLRIGFFLHIPFPPAELFLQIPWRSELAHGMLGADLVGVHTPGDARNVVDIASLVGARVTATGVAVGRRRVEVGAFPISIDTSHIADIAARPETDARVARLRHDLGDPGRVILGIDRLDYTKGITNRLRAFRELLTDGVVRAPDTVMVQVAVPSRERVGSYANERRRVTTLVGEINGTFGQVGRPAVHYLQRSLPLHELVALYRTADVMLVTPLRDGMNLVSKEFVAARIHHRGALVLSEFAGAAHELTDAFLVNPYDVDGLKAALTEALHITPEEEHRRMTALRQVVLEHDVHRWSASFVHRLERRRRSTHPRQP